MVHVWVWGRLKKRTLVKKGETIVFCLGSKKWISKRRNKEIKAKSGHIALRG